MKNTNANEGLIRAEKLNELHLGPKAYFCELRITISGIRFKKSTGHKD